MGIVVGLLMRTEFALITSLKVPSIAVRYRSVSSINSTIYLRGRLCSVYVAPRLAALPSLTQDSAARGNDANRENLAAALRAANISLAADDIPNLQRNETASNSSTSNSDAETQIQRMVLQ